MVGKTFSLFLRVEQKKMGFSFKLWSYGSFQGFFLQLEKEIFSSPLSVMSPVDFRGNLIMTGFGLAPGLH